MNKQRYYSGPEVFNMDRHWTQRVFLASIYADPMGMIVRGVLGLNTRKGAAFGLSATIGKDSIVRTKLRGIHGQVMNVAHPLGTVIALRDEFRRLADHCRLPDAERLELFDQLKKWAGEDLRARSD